MTLALWTRHFVASQGECPPTTTVFKTTKAQSYWLRTEDSQAAGTLDTWTCDFFWKTRL